MFNWQLCNALIVFMIGIGCTDDGTDLAPDGSVPSLCNHVEAKVTNDMDRNRSQAQFHGDDPPAYKDPNDVATEPLGTFQTDSSQPATPLTPEHANLITEELRNLTEGLGFTPASNVDTQLRDAVVPALKSVKQGFPPQNGSGAGWAPSGDTAIVASAANAEWNVRVGLPVGARILGVSARGNDNSTAGNGWFVDVRRNDGTATVSVGDTLSPTFTPPTLVTATQLFATPETVADDNHYKVRIKTPVGSDGTNRIVHQIWLILDLCGAPSA